MNVTIFIKGGDEKQWAAFKKACKDLGTTVSNNLAVLVEAYLASLSKCSCGTTMAADWKYCPTCARPRKELPR